MAPRILEFSKWLYKLNFLSFFDDLDLELDMDLENVDTTDVNLDDEISD